jgi:large subunit ribosomal protein L19e
MKLDSKKLLAAKALSVGKGRIIFNNERLEEIREAITKQDIRDLFASGAVRIREIQGTKKKEKRNTRRRGGNASRKVINKKRNYVIITRKLRKHLAQNKEKIKKEDYLKIRKEIKMKSIKSLAHLREMLKKK